MNPHPYRPFVIGLAVLAVGTLVVGAFITRPDPEVEAALSRARSAQARQARQDATAFIEQLKASGYSGRIDHDVQTLYVDPLFWRTANITQKESIARMAGAYFGRSIATVKDFQSGRNLAKWGSASGVTVY